jgi:hypothetical protein
VGVDIILPLSSPPISIQARKIAFRSVATCHLKPQISPLSEPSCASAHYLTLANKLGVEFRSVEGEENVKIDS